VNPLPPSTSPPADADVVFRRTDAAPEGVDWSTADVLDEQGRRADGVPEFVFARLGDVDAVRIPGAVDYYLRDDEIVCHLVDERHAYLVEIALLGMVMALWLERRGTATLHASVVVVDGVAAGFLGPSGGGKTSTLTACLARGHALLADDLLALYDRDGVVVGARGYPALRLWPEQADRFIGSHEGLPRLHPDYDKRRVLVGEGHFGAFALGAAPLRRLYLPERLDDPRAPVELRRLPAQEALMELLRHSFLPREVQRFGWVRERLAVLARVAAEVPVVRLRYPSGFDLLPDVLARLEDDVRSGRPGVS
jgi:hypothetical protein